MMISKRTATITMIPMMIFLMATGACANCNPFWSTYQIAAPTTVPIRRPVPPRVETPPITDAATPYIS